MASNFNPRGGRCDSCGEHRSLHDGLCHECEQSERESCNCVECGKTQDACGCEGGPWTPGGYRL